MCFLGSSPGSFHLSFFKARQPQVNILIIVLITYWLLQICFDFWDTKVLIITFAATIPLDRLCSRLSCVGPMKPGRTKQLFRIQSAGKVWREQKGRRSGKARTALLSPLFWHGLNAKNLFCPISFCSYGNSCYAGYPHVGAFLRCMTTPNDSCKGC